MHFNPRSPHGERLKSCAYVARYVTFQSTLPAWGATGKRGQYSQDLCNFNPRSPHGERPIAWALYPAKRYFNPRSPHGERRTTDANATHLRVISIHAPRMGSDSTVKAYSNDRIKRSTLREPHFFYSKNACFSPIVSMCATTSRTKKSENQSFIRIISRLGTYVFHLRLISVPQIIEPYAVRLLVHQHFQCGTK